MERTEINQLGEFNLIKRFSKDARASNPSTLIGIGDDAAVMSYGEKRVVVSTDLLLEGVHFDLSYVPLKHLGYKCIVVNLSDIFAMNARPTQVTVSLGLSNRFSVEAVDELFEGIHHACDTYGVDLVGGDTTASLSGMTISVTAIGVANEEDLVYRNGAKVGDLIYASGDLGAAFLGLQLLEREKKIFEEHPGIQPDLEGKDYMVGRQLKPEARGDVVEALASAGVKPTSMIDLSDGLSSDLLHICEASNVGAVINEEEVVIHEEAFDQAVNFNMDPITCALSGGEDYELLFTINPKDEEKLKNSVFFAKVGKIVEAEAGVKLNTKAGNLHEITSLGWENFKDQ